MRMVEHVALAIWQARIGTTDGTDVFDKLVARSEWLGCARAAIDAYESAKMDEMNQHATEFIRDEKGRIVGTKVSA